MWQVIPDTVRHYRSLLYSIYGHLTSTAWILFRQNLLALSTSATCSWQWKSCSFEISILNWPKFNSGCLLKEGLLACKNFDFLKTHISGCTLDAIHFTIMATGHNRFSVLEELTSHAFCKIAAKVSPRWGYPELPNLSDNLLPSYIQGVPRGMCQTPGECSLG